MRQSRLAAALVGASLFTGSAAVVPPGALAGAESIMVTTTEDELNEDGDCSLREAVVAVNTEAPVDACPGAPGKNEIFLQPGEYRLTIPGAGEDAAQTGDLDLLRPTSIRVIADEGATIDGSGLDRIFDVHHVGGISAIHAGITLRNGDAGDEDGGAVRILPVACNGDGGSSRHVDFFGVIVEGNRAGRGGGIHVDACNTATITASSIVRNSAAVFGGGVSAVGRLDLRMATSTVSTNLAGSAGGGVWADQTPEMTFLSFTHVTIAENEAPSAGGIWASGYVIADASLIANNRADNCSGTPRGFLSDDDSCGGPGVEDAGLQPLTIINGYPVHPLAPGSPAIEAAGEPWPGPWCAGHLMADQVGTARPLDGDGDGLAECDAGAIEAPAVARVEHSAGSPLPLPDTSVTIDPRVPPLDLAIIILGVVGATTALRRRSGEPRKP